MLEAGFARQPRNGNFFNGVAFLTLVFADFYFMLLVLRMLCWSWQRFIGWADEA